MRTQCAGQLTGHSSLGLIVSCSVITATTSISRMATSRCSPILMAPIVLLIISGSILAYLVTGPLQRCYDPYDFLYHDDEIERTHVYMGLITCSFFVFASLTWILVILCRKTHRGRSTDAGTQSVVLQMDPVLSQNAVPSAPSKVLIYDAPPSYECAIHNQQSTTPCVTCK